MARIQRIVRDLSSFSHSADDAEASTDVNATVESTLTMLRSELRHRAAVERDLRAGRAARGSPARLSQVFLNLVMNAAQALDRADPGRNRIVVRTYDAEPAGTRDGDGAEPGDAAVIFEVSDNGPGIAPEVLPRIFDSFFTTKPRGVGTGLGLPISQGIVRGLGGEITVESRPGQGATFRVRLPVASVASGERSPAAAAPVVYGRRSVLAVDDEALLLKAYRRMLSDVHQVTTALGGREAIRLLERQRDFDVVLCDLQMPEMSGMELYATVRERFPEVADRFVFVTGGAFSADAQRFLEQAVTSIGKPFQVEELLALIEEKSGPHGAPAGETAGAALPGSPPAPSSPPQTLTERRE
jgi:CheY-like chemotaxis protein